jgi:hypothetical protein
MSTIFLKSLCGEYITLNMSTPLDVVDILRKLNDTL